MKKYIKKIIGLILVSVWGTGLILVINEMGFLKFSFHILISCLLGAMFIGGVWLIAT